MKKTTALLLVAGFVLCATPLAQVHADDGTTTIVHPVVILNGSGGSNGVIAGSTSDPGDGKLIAPILKIAGDTTSIHNEPTDLYTDIQGHFASAAITRLTEAGLITSNSTTSFQPDAQIGRSDFKTWLQNAIGVSTQDSNASATTVTRVEVAQWVAAALPGLNTGPNNQMSINPYDDTNGLTADQIQAVNYLYQLGVMVGDGHRHFSPNATLSRGQAAVLISNVLDRSLASGTGVTFDAVDSALPDAVNQALNAHQQDTGLYTVVDSGSRYLVVTGGTVPTGGYSVTVDNVTETAAGIFVQASLHAPAPGTMVNQLVSYPHAVVKISDTTKPIYLVGK